MDDIADRNNIPRKSDLRLGQQLWIINPKLGDLKVELKQARQEFIDYLSGNQIKK